MELVRRRAQRLGQHGEVLDLHRQLAAARLEHAPVDADQVAEVEVEQPLVLLGAEDVDLRLDLDAAGAVLEVEERHLALAAAGHEAPGEADALLGLRAVLEPVEARVDVGDRRDAGILVREGVDAVGAELLELRPPGGEQIVAHGALARDLDLRDLELARRAVGQLDRDDRRSSCGR